MRKFFFIVFLTALSLTLSGCLPAKKQIIVPEYDREGKQVSAGSAGEVSADQQVKQVPGIFHESPEAEKDEMMPPTSEEDIAGPDGGPSLRHDGGKTKTAAGTGLPDQKFVSYRLDEYSKELMEWNEMAETMVAFDVGYEWPDQWHDCVLGLEYMVFGYKKVNSLLQSADEDSVSPQSENPWDIVQRDVYYLESNCEKVLRQGEAFLDEAASDYRARNVHSVKALIQQLMSQGDYQGVISAYENSAVILKGEFVDFAVHSSYAQALAHKNRFEESLQFIRKKLMQEKMLQPSLMSESKSVWRAMMQYADLLLIMGQDSMAKSVYLQLDDLFAEMEKDSQWVVSQLHFINDYSELPEKHDAFVVLLTEYMKYDGRGIPQSLRTQYEHVLADYDDIALDSIAGRVMRKVEDRARRWAKEKLLEADYLAQEKDFNNARKILETITGLPDDMAGEVAETLKTVSRLEKEDARMQRMLEQEQFSVQWDNAVALLEAGEYEKAVEAFSSLSGSKYGPKAQKKVKEAQNAHAVQLRNEAADLFAAALNEEDPARKENMMMQSKDILQYILSSYPEANIVNKVEENLQVLEDQIRLFNPALLRSGEEE
jgi:hypothetical protein